jgi:NAD(P)-dependent dehydrogenase (short-subunit alcohol dehydrogenase family)
MENSLKILITGGTRGLGRRIAENLIGQGHEIYITGKTAKEEIDQSYLSVITDYLECDMSNIKALDAAIRILINKIGRIDVLINNAVVRESNMVGNFHTDEIQNTFNVDLISAVVLSNLCLPFMKRNNFGRIINISSISAYNVYKTGSLYCSSKRALITFSETLSKELTGLNGAVTVNTICPDSFSSLNGTREKNYQRITESVLSNIENFINSKSNGKVISIFTFKHKIKERLRCIGQALSISQN